MENYQKLKELIQGAKRKIYNPLASCEKCGGNWISTNYLKSGDVMKRKCPCGHVWYEDPLNKESE